MNDLNPSRASAARMWSGGLLALFLAAGFPSLETSLRADNPPTYLFQWGSPGTGAGQFNYPDAMAVDNSNNVYVVDTFNTCVEKFNRNGNYLTQWGSPGNGNGQFESPSGIAVDSGNNVYVVDSYNERVEKFDCNGNYLTQWGGPGTGNGQFEYVGWIAVDNSNNVYVVDTANSRVEKFDSNGNYLAQWGSPGTGNGQFEGADGIAVDGGNNVYVVDQDNYRIEKFDSNGNYLTQWGSLGNGNGQFIGPTGIAVDSASNVYVADAERVEKFDNDGNYLTQWGSEGTGNGQFEGAQGIALEGSGNVIYVVDLGDRRVEVFANSVTQLPPYITSQPASQSVVAGVTISLSVATVGGEPMTYQWTSNDVALPDATNSALTLTNFSLAVAATYDVLVTNSIGNGASSNFVLTVVPALVNTLPATGVGAAGAVLNGSVSVGEDTIAWFNWGADTNYGHSTAMTIVPGASGTTNLSATLDGLTTNVYYYQIVASNISGVVYGNDQSFVVADRAPTVTTLSPVAAANGVTLYAMVNPNGLDTTVYFNWGTNTTPVMDVGAGDAPLNVSSLITGLAPASRYNYEVVASNSLGVASGALLTFYSPPFVSVPNENWQSVALSADGTFMVAVVNLLNGSTYGPVFVSTNAGMFWSQATNAPQFGWQTVACSANGSNIVAASGGSFGLLQGPIYTSPDGGNIWVSNNAPVLSWESVASSADGAKLAAAGMDAIYTSTNAGAAWTKATNAPSLPWECIAMSADGSKLAAGAFSTEAPPTNIYTSTNFGANWITHPVIASSGSIPCGWISIASSADGARLLAAAGGDGNSGRLFLSTNSGTTWSVTATNIVLKGFLPWIWVASSADGSRLAALANEVDVFSTLNGLWTSTNYGATWASASSAYPTWTSAAMSADGGKLLATIGWPTTSSEIYVAQTALAPALNLTASDNGPIVSWLIPSMDFTLQRSFDLSSWTDVTNPPVLDLTNLQHQVALPPPNANTFYRLMH